MRTVASGVIAGVLAALTLVADAQPASDVERAKDLYKSAEAAMHEARFDDAIRDYGAAYEITKDPTFFYKIGSANERAGKCDVALIYYRRYLKEGKPNEAFAKLTSERITACEPAGRVEPETGAAEPKPEPKASPGGAAPTEPEAKPEPKSKPEPKPKPEPKARPEPGPLPPEPLAASAEPTPEGGGSSTPPSARHKGPWLLIGGSIALVTVGAVFAYSANAAERDVDDLYVGLNGTPPPFNDSTRKLYDDAIAEGKRYQALSIASFGVAGAMAIGAALWFVLDRDQEITVAPAAAPGTAGVSTTIRF